MTSQIITPTDPETLRDARLEALRWAEAERIREEAARSEWALIAPAIEPELEFSI